MNNSIKKEIDKACKMPIFCVGDSAEELKEIMTAYMWREHQCIPEVFVHDYAKCIKIYLMDTEDKDDINIPKNKNSCLLSIGSNCSLLGWY